jgi:hypothetical protein
MSVQDILNNVQTIGSMGDYQTAPKLPKPKPQKINYVNVASPINRTTTTVPTGGMSALDRLVAAIKKQESGGNYRATNPSGASGAYQILRSNFEGPGGWDRNALGRDVNYDQFISNPQIQDAIARYQLNLYLQKYGPAGAAVAWYGGPGAVSHMYDKSPQPGGYPSLYAYMQSVLNKM